jgi:hypothetical protein
VVWGMRGQQRSAMWLSHDRQQRGCEASMLTACQGAQCIAFTASGLEWQCVRVAVVHMDGQLDTTVVATVLSAVLVGAAPGAAGASNPVSFQGCLGGCTG